MWLYLVVLHLMVLPLMITVRLSSIITFLVLDCLLASQDLLADLDVFILLLKVFLTDL